MNNYYIYILTNARRTIFYIGVTNNLERRIFEHKKSLIAGFTKKYNVDVLIYFEETSDVTAAILREKQLKKWSRAKKLDLIRQLNPNFIEITARSLDKLEMTANSRPVTSNGAEKTL